jgi:O-antigen/teichoic acid export membrane protein
MTGASMPPPAWWLAFPAPLRRLLERLPAGFWRAARSTGWHMVGHVVRLVVGLVVGLYVARYLGPESYGVLNYAIGFAFLFSALAHLGLADIVVRDLVARPERQGEILGSALALRVMSTTVALALVAAAAWATQADATTRLMIMVIAGGFALDAMSAPAEWFKSKVLAGPIVIATLIGMAAASILRVAFVLLEKPVIWFAWPALFEAALAAALTFAFYHRHGGLPLARWHPCRQRMRELLAQCWPLTLAAGLAQVQHRIDQVMLGEMLGPTEVGWYAAAARMSQLWYFVPFAVSMAVFPALVRARETSQELYERRMQAFFDFMLWLAVAISLPAALVAAPLVHLLYGAAYAPSADVLQIHIWSLVLNSILMTTWRWMMAEGLTRALLGFSIVTVGANILFNLLLIPSFGAVGAAWATLGAYCPAVVLRFYYRPTRPTAMMTLRAVAAPVRLLMRTA